MKAETKAENVIEEDGFVKKTVGKRRFKNAGTGQAAANEHPRFIGHGALAAIDMALLRSFSSRFMVTVHVRGRRRLSMNRGLANVKAPLTVDPSPHRMGRRRKSAGLGFMSSMREIVREILSLPQPTVSSRGDEGMNGLIGGANHWI